MEWNDLKSGCIIKYSSCHVTASKRKTFCEFILMLHNICNDKATGEMLTGFGYSWYDYNELIVSIPDEFRTIMIPRLRFEKSKKFITFSTEKDLLKIKSRLKNHIASYEAECTRQKEWAEDLLKKTEKFYEGNK